MQYSQSLGRDPNHVPIGGHVQFRTSKTVTFDGVSAGAVSPLQIFQVTGTVLIDLIIPVVKQSLASAGAATLGLGCVNNGQFFTGPTAYTNLVAGAVWVGNNNGYDTNGADLNNFNGIKNHVLRKNILLDTLVAAITAGQIEIVVLWRPISSDGNLVAL